MIHFFRNIRQYLLAENKVKPYLKYAFGEIILVVLGILIALQINNWNEKKKLESKTQDYYVQLLDDLNSDKIFIKETIGKFNGYLGQFEEYTNSFSTEKLTPKQVYEQISRLPINSTPLTFNSNTLETLQNSGDLGLIPARIRNKLIDLKRQQDLTIKRAEFTDNGKNGVLQNLTPLIGASTFTQRLLNQPELNDFFHLDKNLRETILVYEGVHRWKSFSEQETVGRLENLLVVIDSIISLIKEEMK